MDFLAVWFLFATVSFLEISKFDSHFYWYYFVDPNLIQKWIEGTGRVE